MYNIRVYRNIGLGQHSKTVYLDLELPFVPIPHMHILTEHNEIIVKTVTFSLEENRFSLQDTGDLTWLPDKERRDDWFKQQNEIIERCLECGWSLL